MANATSGENLQTAEARELVNLVLVEAVGIEHHAVRAACRSSTTTSSRECFAGSPRKAIERDGRSIDRPFAKAIVDGYVRA